MMTWRDDNEREAADGCAAFEAVIPDYLDGALTVDAAEAAASHLAGCDACRLLVRDLQTIRTRAAELPVLSPSRDLWAGVEARLQPRAGDGWETASAEGSAVRSIGARQTAQRRWVGSPVATRITALAAGLVIATAAVTYATTRWLAGSTLAVPPQIATVQPSGATADNQSVTPSVTGRMPMTGSSSVTEVSRRAVTSEYLYDSQIASLHKILDQRRSQLSPKTVAVIERNLGVIDTAIAQSKAALAKDPANGFLSDQLGRDLDTKLELLRTVALLPSHT